MALVTGEWWGTLEAGVPGEWAAAPGVSLPLSYPPHPAPPVALVPLDVAFEAGLATGAPPPPAAGVALILPGGGNIAGTPPLAQAPSLEALWKDWPRVRAALRRRPGGGKDRKDWPEAAPGGVVVAGRAAAAAAGGAKGKKKKR